MQLRYYQQEAIDATWRYLRERSGNPCVVIPTGGGKTPVLATMARDAVTNWGGRVVILAHVKELLEQSIDKLRAVAPDLKVGAFSAGLGRKETDADVVVAGIQSVYKHALSLDRRDLVFIDEAHLIPPDGEGRYRTFLDDLQAANPHVRLIGLTATPYRMASGSICGPENLLHDVAYEVGVRELILRGFLSPLKSRKGLAFDSEGLHTARGDYVEHEAAARMLDTLEPALDNLVALTQGRRSILVFATGIDHAHQIASGVYRRTGERVEVVTGETPAVVRARLVREFKGETGGIFDAEPLRWLINVGVFTTGFDAPNVDCVALMRATLSPGLYYQMVGRGFRLCEGKADCLVLDFGGNVERHGPVDELNADGIRKGKDGEAPVKECPQCGAFVGIAFGVCMDCGYIWPPPEPKPKHAATASDAAVTTLEITDDDKPVERVFYSVHEKRNAPEGAPKTLRVDYDVGEIYPTSEWVCVEHTGYPGQKARNWWAQRSAAPFPKSAAEACQIAKAGGLADVKQITVRTIPGEKFPRVVGYQLGPIPEPPEILAPIDAVAERFAAVGHATITDVMMAFPEDAPTQEAAEALLEAVAQRFDCVWDWLDIEGSFSSEKGIVFPSHAIPDDDIPF